MFDKIVDSLNKVSARVWSFLQFLALLGAVGGGVYLMAHGHAAEGTGLMTGAFALLRNEVSGPQQ
jgi:hypothetical protein